MTATSPPRSAYLHVPFCRHRCGYCNFAVVAGRDDLIPVYLEALAKELGALGEPRPVETLYLGGGTPTHLGNEQLDELLGLARHWFPPLHGDCHTEWTVEANPEDISAETIRALASHGVTRLSLGSQSFDADKLRRLERGHTAEQIEQAVLLAHSAEMQASVDLIFAAPDESLSAWQEDVRRAISLQPDHVSVYGLTYEKGTRFWSELNKGFLHEREEDLQRDMYLLAIDHLTEAGFEHYEVSNFAQAGKRSRHNESYWTGREYYAAGPGAARYVDGVRETNHASTTTWLKRVQAGESAVALSESLDPEQRARERLVFGLRRLEGIAHSEFEAATGFSIDDLAGESIRRHIEVGLLNDDGARLKLTREGLLVSDALWPELL